VKPEAGFSCDALSNDSKQSMKHLLVQVFLDFVYNSSSNILNF